MKKLLALLLLPMAAFAGTEFATPAGTTSYFTPCFPLYATASDGAGTLTGMSGTDANFVISIHDDDASTETEFQTTADIETISTIGTYAAPTADTDIRFGECATGGTYQLQFRDTFLADNGTNMLTVKLTDGVDTMGDQIVYINLNVAALADIGTEVRDTPCGTPTADTFGGQVCTEIDDANTAIAELNIDLGEPVGVDFSADIAAIEAQTDDIGVAGAGLTNIDLPNQTMDITGSLSGSVGTLTGHTVQTGDSFARIGAAGVALAEAGGTGDQYTAVPYNSAWNADIESEATDALNAYDPPTDAEMIARTTTTAAYATSAGVAAAQTDLDTLTDPVSEPSGVPAWDSASFIDLVAWLSAWSRNEVQQTGATKTLRNDADDDDLATCDVSDNGTTFQRDECQ